MYNLQEMYQQFPAMSSFAAALDLPQPDESALTRDALASSLHGGEMTQAEKIDTAILLALLGFVIFGIWRAGKRGRQG